MAAPRAAARGCSRPPAAADTSVQLLGVRRPHPVLIAPTAFASLTHPDGELGIATAAAATSTIMCLATLSASARRTLAAAAPEAPRWFQLYVFTDRGVSRELSTAAAAHGYEALVVTVDRPVLGFARARASRRRAHARDLVQGRSAERHVNAVIDRRPELGRHRAASPPTARCRCWSRACSRPRTRGWRLSTARPG